MLKGCCGKAKTKDLLLPLAQNVVKSMVVLVCVCDPLPASGRLHLWGKRSALANGGQGRPAGTVRHPEIGIKVQAFTVVVVVYFTRPASQEKGDNCDVLCTVQNGVWHDVKQ